MLVTSIFSCVLPAWLQQPIVTDYTDQIYLTIFNTINSYPYLKSVTNANDFKPERTGKADDIHPEFNGKSHFIICYINFCAINFPVLFLSSPTNY
jgi:hypothetical protein